MSLVATVMSKLQSMLAAIDFKLIKILRQRNLNSSESID